MNSSNCVNGKNPPKRLGIVLESLTHTSQKGDFMKRASFLTSSIGKKQLMGIAGLFWCGFVLTHMAGNLLYLVGPEAYNSYGHAITANKEIYYPLEVALAVSLLA